MLRTYRTTGELRAGCSKRLSGKTAAREAARRTLRYVEPLSDARTMLADFFSILLGALHHSLSASTFL
jgi:CYTH domain-containing protein